MAYEDHPMLREIIERLQEIGAALRRIADELEKRGNE